MSKNSTGDFNYTISFTRGALLLDLVRSLGLKVMKQETCARKNIVIVVVILLKRETLRVLKL